MLKTKFIFHSLQAISNRLYIILTLGGQVAVNEIASGNGRPPSLFLVISFLIHPHRKNLFCEDSYMSKLNNIV